MTTIYEASIVGDKLRIRDKAIDKKKAMSRVRQGKNVYTTKSQAHTLSIALNEGGGAWKDGPHLVGGYRHYHDGSHRFAGHIFYGEPSG